MSLFVAPGPDSGAETQATRRDSSAEAMRRLREPFAVEPADSGDQPVPEPREPDGDSGQPGSARKDR
jgi:hypothetical protein